ncbi:MAG: hypothetical protein ACREC5_06910, partial [Thermoplasmata archaeon]
MSGEPRRDPRRNPPEPGDTAYADAYAAGFGEGLRESLREVLQHAARGHTTAEIRILVESRIARIPEETELKRRSLVSPPRRPAWGALLRPPAPVAPEPPSAPGPGASAGWQPGTSYLFREERPREGIRFAREVADRHQRIVWVSHDDPPALGVPGERVVSVRPSARPPGGSAGAEPGEIAGRVQRARTEGGPVLAYVDALEFFVTEFGSEPTVRFATWLGTWARESGSTCILSVDPGTLE